MNIYLISGFVSIIFISVALMMALISRNNFSKYKGRLIPGLLQNLIRGYIRKGGIYNTAEFEAVSEEYLYRLYKFTGIIILFSNFIFLLFLYTLSNSSKSNEVKRPLTGDPPIEVEINTGEKGESNLLLKVYPLEYTDEEFKEISDEAYRYAVETMKGKNNNLQEIKENLSFPEEDESGTITFKWNPDRVDLIGSSGNVYRDDLQNDETVSISLEMTDGIHQREELIDVTICGRDKEEENTNPIYENLVQIEKERRNEETVVLPKSIEGETIRVGETDKYRNIILGMLIIPVIAFMLVYHKINKLKEKSDERQNELKMQYFSFVNRLSLMLGSGLGMKESIRLAAEGNKKLTEEINFCINQINSGVSETKAYSDMAKRISIPEYTRLMALISQNIEHGNSKVLMLMDQEVKNAMNIKREHLRRNGEVASEKLLIPTALLLIIVIGLIMIPAFYGLR